MESEITAHSPGQQTTPLPSMTREQVIAGIEHLTDLIESLVAQDKTVYIISLSRKMPRIITWAGKLAETTAQRLRDALDRCVYTTELAIPIVFQGKLDPQKNSILILDDVIINGETVSNTCSDIHYVTGIKPDFWCFCVYQRALMPLDAREAHLYSKELYSELEAANVLYSISSIISENELPTDLEFPILHIPRSADPHLAAEDFTEDFTSDLRAYSLPDALPEAPRSLIPSRTLLTTGIGGYDMQATELEKARLFIYDDEYRLTLFAPTTLTENLLRESDLYTDPLYNRIWQTVSNAIRSCCPVGRQTPDGFGRVDSQFAYHRDRLRAITANYLFSLSTMLLRYRSLRESMTEDGIRKTEQMRLAARISASDLALLFGPDVAEKILPDLQAIVHNDIISMRPIEFGTLPDTYAPEEYLTEYLGRKVMLANDAEGHSLPKTILRMFAEAYRIVGKDKHDAFSSINAEKTIHETIHGLADALIGAALFRSEILDEQKKTRIQREINRVLDLLIDMGIVIPRYQRVYNSSREYLYWRRYFHGSHMLFRRRRHIDAIERLLVPASAQDTL